MLLSAEEAIHKMYDNRWHDSLGAHRGSRLTESTWERQEDGRFTAPLSAVAAIVDLA